MSRHHASFLPTRSRDEREAFAKVRDAIEEYGEAERRQGLGHVSFTDVMNVRVKLQKTISDLVELVKGGSDG